MGKKSVRYLDKKLNEDSTLSSMMIIVPLEDGKVRFDCKICGRDYCHHPSLFRHFRSAHKEQYEKCLALRRLIQSKRRAAKLLGIPYPRRKNCKRKFRIGKGKKESHEPPTIIQEEEGIPPLPNLEIDPSDISPTDSNCSTLDFPLSHLSDLIKIEQQQPFIFMDLICKACSMEFQSEYQMINHMPECRGPTLDGLLSNIQFPQSPLQTQTVFHCSSCQYVFIDEIALNDHINQFHPLEAWLNNTTLSLKELQGVPGQICPQCNKIFENVTMLNQHICMSNVFLQFINA